MIPYITYANPNTIKAVTKAVRIRVVQIYLHSGCPANIQCNTHMISYFKYPNPDSIVTDANISLKGPARLTFMRMLSLGLEQQLHKGDQITINYS